MPEWDAPKLTIAHYPSSVCRYSEYSEGSDCFLPFPLLCYSLPSPVDGSIWGLTRSQRVLHCLEIQRRCREQPQPGVVLCLFRTAELAAYYCWASQAHTTRQESRLRSQMKLREKVLWSDGCSETPTNRAGYLRYAPRAALLFYVCLCIGVYVPVWDMCTHVMHEPVRGQRSTLVLWPQELPPCILRQCHFLEPEAP